jgi:hypothetical protein
VRAAVLTGREFRFPPWDTLRELRNEVIKLGAAINNTPPGPVRDRTEEAMIDALDRITRF